MLRWLRVAVIGAALALPLPGGGPMLVSGAASPLAAGPLTAVAAGAAVALVPATAEAQRAAGSSGGYSRPGGRTPSFGAPSGGFGRTPSTSGGYGRPSPGASGLGRAPLAPPSASDRDITRRWSGDALQRYRSQQQQDAQRFGQAPPQGPMAIPGPVPVPDGGFGANRRRGAYGGWYPDRPGWAAARGWSVPQYAYRASPSFGIWNGLFLWFLLDSLTRPGHAEFFHNHQNDPGYAQWRAQAEQLAQQDPELRAKLNDLDARLTELQGRPRDPDYLPPGTSPEVALADQGDAARGDSGFGGLLVPLLIGGGVLFLFVYWRRQQAAGRARRSGGPGSMGPLKTATGILRHKMSGERYTPSLFRVGMTITLDPTPFILAQGVTKVTPPDGVSGTNQLVSIEAVGTVEDGATTLHRLYLPENRGFFQLHLDADGRPDECRFFSPLDEVSPADESEWGFWLDPQEGMIGWPEFQTKDGKVYPRIWAPGQSRIPPRTLHETINDVRGMTLRRSDAMLYGAPTGAEPPAPPTEFILVAAVEEAGQAWIAIHAGIDVNPAALSLA